MSATPSSPVEPQAGSVAVPSNLDQAEESITQRILKYGPPWLRWTALILAALAPYSKYPIDYFQQRNAAKHIAEANPYPTINGKPDPAKTDPASRSQFEMDDKDRNHIVWHHDVKNENPPLVTIFDNNEKGLLAYKLFDSDGCLLVERAKGGAHSTNLVRSLDRGNPDSDSGYESPILPLDGTNVGRNEPKSASPPRGHAKLIRAQANCLNPHPGQFRYWYGPPADQCSVPMYRQFTDGCTHYQMFNRCNNAFDPQIHWTQCVARHSW